MATGKGRTGLNPSAYMGVEASAPPQLLINTRRPTSSDVARYNIGTLWIIQNPQEVWMLATVVAYNAVWIQLFPGSGAGATIFPCDIGTATEASSILEVHGEPLKNINTKGVGNIVTVALNDTVSITGSFHADATVDAGIDVIATHDLVAGNDIASGQTVTAGHGVHVLSDGIDSTGATYLRDLASTPDKLLKVDSTGLIGITTAASGNVSFFAILEKNSSNLQADFYGADGAMAYIGAKPDETGASVGMTVLWSTLTGFNPGNGAGTGASFTAPSTGKYFFNVTVSTTVSSPPAGTRWWNAIVFLTPGYNYYNLPSDMVGGDTYTHYRGNNASIVLSLTIGDKVDFCLLGPQINNTGFRIIGKRSFNVPYSPPGPNIDFQTTWIYGYLLGT